jgi:hypothetical protein
MVFGYFRFKLDARPHVCRLILSRRLTFGLARSVGAMPASMWMSIRRALWLLMSGVLVCTALAACGGRDDDHAVSSTTSQDESQPDSQVDSSTVANASPPASGALVPPVMHYAQ